MDLETAWDARPDLRDAMRAQLDAAEFDALTRRRPEISADSSSGTLWNTWRSRDGRWPTVDGAGWELRFELDRGLSTITARYPSEEALRSAVARWGPPDIVGRWEVWLHEETHTQAAFTGCDYDSWVDDQPLGDLRCRIEWRPMQSASEAVRTVFPEGRTLIGTRRGELRLGAGIPFGDFTRFHLWPLPSELWMPLEVQLDEADTVTAYRTVLPHAYDPAGRERNLRALRDVLPVTEAAAGSECFELELDGARARLCESRSQIDVTVGDWH